MPENDKGNIFERLFLGKGHAEQQQLLEQIAAGDVLAGLRSISALAEEIQTTGVINLEKIKTLFHVDDLRQLHASFKNAARIVTQDGSWKKNMSLLADNRLKTASKLNIAFTNDLGQGMEISYRKPIRLDSAPWKGERFVLVDGAEEVASLQLSSFQESHPFRLQLGDAVFQGTGKI